MKAFIAIIALIGAVFSEEFPNHEPFSQELIDYVNNKPGNTWKAGVNDHFKDVPLKVVRAMMGVKRIKNPKIHSEMVSPKEPKEIPATFDARTAWPECASRIGEVRDQAACGSCWAFGCVEAITDRICIASKGKYMPHISAEDLNSCCYSCGSGCGGGDPGQAWQYWVNTGLVTGGNYSSQSGCMPYEIPNCDHHTQGRFKPCGSEVPTPMCKKECRTGYDKSFNQDKWYGKTAYHVEQNIEAIQREIMTNGPLETDFNVYADFLSYKSGVYRHTSGGFQGGHAVKALGWGTENGTPYWLIANSWNTDWGDKGFFKILRGQNECGIEQDMNGGIPKLP